MCWYSWLVHVWWCVFGGACLVVHVWGPGNADVGDKRGVASKSFVLWACFPCCLGVVLCRAAAGKEEGGWRPDTGALPIRRASEGICAVEVRVPGGLGLSACTAGISVCASRLPCRGAVSADLLFKLSSVSGRAAAVGASLFAPPVRAAVGVRSGIGLVSVSVSVNVGVGSQAVSFAGATMSGGAHIRSCLWAWEASSALCSIFADPDTQLLGGWCSRSLAGFSGVGAGWDGTVLDWDS